MKTLAALFVSVTLVAPFSAEAGCAERLFITAGNGDTYTLKKLLDAGADPNCYYKDSGNTALHRAAASGHPEVISMLVEAGADPNARNNDRATALHLAAGMGQAEAIGALAGAGADLNLPDKDDDSPLHYATYSDFASFLSVMVSSSGISDLASHEDEMTRRTVKVIFALHEAGATVRTPSSWGDSGQAVAALLAYDADPNLKNKDGRNPLHYAERLATDFESSAQAATALQAASAAE